jgi:hypothetical protein
MTGTKQKRVAQTALKPVDGIRQELERVTLSAHGEMRFRPIANYLFAQGAMVADIAAAELAQAAINFPLAFVGRDEALDLVALLSTTPGRNLFVSDKGLWLADYVPASVCTYPFQYCTGAGGGAAALFVDMKSGLLTMNEGQPLFTEAGKPSDKTREIVHILRTYEKSRRATRKACAQLRQFNLLVPWGADCEVETLRKLWRVDEAMLNRLPQGAFEVLRQGGALPIIYAHLLSLALLPRLVALARMHSAADASKRKLLHSCFRMEEGLMDDSFKF